MTIEILESALHLDQTDNLTWLALADALEEHGEPDRAEVVRLSLRYWGRIDDQPFDTVNERLQHLLASGVPPCVPEWVNSVGMRFALIPSGTFLMGSPEEQEVRYPEEGHQHEVEISQAFYMGVYEVTQGQYERVMGKNPSYFSQTGKGKEKVSGLDTVDFPVECVSWEDAVEFCKKLNALDGKKPRGYVYLLPTEAEWEYSCRGGASSYQAFHFGNSLSSTQANFDGNYPYGGADKGPYLERTCKVGSYPPNAFGLYDMHGNVWEWCQDWYGEKYYATSPPRDPDSPPNVSYRVLRGGCWGSTGQSCRSAIRSWYTLSNGSFFLGFRVALAPNY